MPRLYIAIDFPDIDDTLTDPLDLAANIIDTDDLDYRGTPADFITAQWERHIRAHAVNDILAAAGWWGGEGETASIDDLSTGQAIDAVLGQLPAAPAPDGIVP